MANNGNFPILSFGDVGRLGHYYPNRSLFDIVKSTGNSDNLLCRMNILSNKHTCTIENIALIGRNFLI